MFNTTELDRELGRLRNRMVRDDMPEVECQDCRWQGDDSELVGLAMRCPECGSDDVCDYED